MQNSAIKKIGIVLLKTLPLISFIIPMILLYMLFPASFETTWKGRTYYLLFLWIVMLEIIMNWDDLKEGTVFKKTPRTLVYVLALAAPTIYVTIANFGGLNTAILNLVEQYGMTSPWADWMPLSTEYLVFAALFAIITVLGYGVKGLNVLLLSTAFLGVLGFVYTLDNFYPYGQFTPFQIIVPTTATLAAGVLTMMGYNTYLTSSPQGMPVLYANTSTPPIHEWGAQIAWPCAGVDSLLIYTITVLLFLRKSAISWKAKLVYFIVGAAVTYSINIMRIVAIFVIGVSNGWPDAQAFHDFYGQMYSIIWIVTYPLIIIGTQALWERFRGKEQQQTATSMHSFTKSI